MNRLAMNNLALKICWMVALSFVWTQPRAQDSAPKEQQIKSPAGYVAEWKWKEEGHAILTLSHNGKTLSTIDGAKPVSFSPDGKILLVREAMQDDDCRHYLLNLGKGEYRKAWAKGKELRIGGRYVIDAKWSEDGKTITLVNYGIVGGSTIIEVSKHCRQ